MNSETFKTEFIRLMGLQSDGEDREQEIHALLDQGYQFYLSGSDEYCAEVRDGIVVEDFHKWRETGQRVLLNYRTHAKKMLKNTGNVEWLQRNLVALSIDNGSRDYREEIGVALPKIFKLAVKKGIDPRPVFRQVAEVSDERVKKWLIQKAEVDDIEQVRGSSPLLNVVLIVIIVLVLFFAIRTILNNFWGVLILVLLFAPYFIYRWWKQRKNE